MNETVERGMPRAHPSSPWCKCRFVAGEFFEDSQGMFVESAHGDGDAQATGEARGFVDRAQGAGVCAGASVLSAAERVAGGGGLRRVRREPLREVLCGPVRSSVADAWDLLP